MSASLPRPPALSRNTAIVGGVVLFHVAALWALQSGLLRRAAEIVLPATIITELIEPPQPMPEPPKPAPQPAPQPVQQPRKATPPPAPRPVAIADPTPAPNAVQGTTEPQPPLPPVSAPVAAVPAPPTPPAAPKIVLPTKTADYAEQCRGRYPPLSQRLNETGRTLMTVVIGTDGVPSAPTVKRSSGYERLDAAALQAVMSCRFTPGTRDGVPEAMRYDLPFDWVLNPR